MVTKQHRCLRPSSVWHWSRWIGPPYGVTISDEEDRKHENQIQLPLIATRFNSPPRAISCSFFACLNYQKRGGLQTWPHMAQKPWGSYRTSTRPSHAWLHQWLTLAALHLLTPQSERWQMLNGEETDDWVFGSYNQHSTYFWVMNHCFYPSHTVLVHSLHRKPLLCKGLMAGQWTPLLAESWQETALESSDLTAKGCCVQYCSLSFASHTPSSGNVGLLARRSLKSVYSQ